MNNRRRSGNGESRSELQSRGSDRGMQMRSNRMQPYLGAMDWPLGRDLTNYPSEVLRRIRQDMDRFFEDFGTTMRRGDRGDRQTMSVWSPRTEMIERDNKLIVRVELPGLKRQDVKVCIQDDNLVIEGERRQDEEQRSRGYIESEWFYGRFYREIPLPESVNDADVKANFRDGVLEVELPIPENARERREIPIEAS